MDQLHVITSCSRFDELWRVSQAFYPAMLNTKGEPAHTLSIRWHVAFQDSRPDPHGCAKFNEMIDLVPEDAWIWILDDDNDIHPFFFQELEVAINVYEKAQAIVFSQKRKDILGPILHAHPANMRPNWVDTAQVVFKKSFLGDIRFPVDQYTADGITYQQLFKKDMAAFAFVDKPLVYHNGGKS